MNVRLEGFSHCVSKLYKLSSLQDKSPKLSVKYTKLKSSKYTNPSGRQQLIFLLIQTLLNQNVDN